METILTKTKHYAVNEKQLIELLYLCPLGLSLKTCVLYNIRKIIIPDFKKAIKISDKNKIPELLAEHNKCLYKRITNLPYLKWTKNGKLDFLTSELIKYKWIKSQSNFAKLFDNTDLNLKVYWNKKYKYELAYLLFKLKESDCYRPVNTKGYFKIAEKYIVDYSGKTFKNNALVKISSKISLNPNKYIDIIEKVDNIIKTLN